MRDEAARQNKRSEEAAAAAFSQWNVNTFVRLSMRRMVC